jgi:hypothetical protein
MEMFLDLKARFNRRTMLLLGIGLALLSLLLTFRGLLPARAAVTVAYFRAVPADQTVVVEWGTQTEIDNVGFYVNRSLQQQGPFEHVSGFIFSTGDGLTGDEYSYDDDNVQNGTTYYYQLESVDVNNASEFHGPVSAVPGQSASTATLTPTATITPTTTTTPTPTATTASQGPYPPAPTNTPRTPYPGPVTNTPRVTTNPSQPSTSTPTPQPYPGPATATSPAILASQPTATFIPFNSSSSSTLVPLPSVTIEFPDATPVAALSMISRSPDSAEMTKQGPAPQSRSLRSLAPLAFIVLIWLLLGAWFYFSMRQME